MDSTQYTLVMLGTGGAANQYLFVTMGFGTDTVEPRQAREYLSLKTLTLERL